MHTVVNTKSAEMTDDEALVKLAKAGNDDAFEELMRRSWDRALHLAVRYLRVHEDAVDEVQSAYWKAYTHLSTFSEKAKFSTWVGAIVVNNCIMRLRSSRRARVCSFDQTPGITQGRPMREKRRWCDPEEKLGSRELSDLVQSELRCVPPLLRTAVEMHHLQGMSLKEIGCRLGITVGAVKARVSRGNQYLRARMTRHLGQRGVASLTY